MNIRVLQDKIAVQIEPAATQTPDGLYIPAVALGQDEVQRAVVVTVGPDVKSVGEGETILIPTRHLPMFEVEGEQVAILLEKNVLGVFE